MTPILFVKLDPSVVAVIALGSTALGFCKAAFSACVFPSLLNPLELRLSPDFCLYSFSAPPIRYLVPIYTPLNWNPWNSFSIAF